VITYYWVVGEAHFSYNEFILLYSLQILEKPVSPNTLIDYMFLSKRTILFMLDKLEEKELIKKECHPQDKRKMQIELNEAGSEFVLEARRGVCLHLRNILWRALPEDEFQALAWNIGISVGMLSRGTPEQQKCAEFKQGIEPLDYFPVDHFIFWRRIVELWTDIVRRSSELSLYSFLMLLVFDESKTTSEKEVSSKLFLDRSGVSRNTKFLLKRQLIQIMQDKRDGRKYCTQLTKGGKEVLDSTCEKLSEFTRYVHSSSTEDQILMWRAWIPRMYRNLRAEKLKDFSKDFSGMNL
jgi:DNA-binding MarR family transcriptional regulator